MRATAPPPDPRELRARCAWAGLPLYVLAGRVRVHPVRLGRLLRGREALRPELAERIARAIAELSNG
jgi:plasmid maintenance system antidote protein VapI